MFQEKKCDGNVKQEICSKFNDSRLSVDWGNEVKYAEKPVPPKPVDISPFLYNRPWDEEDFE